jgi:hypothetical protein
MLLIFAAPKQRGDFAGISGVLNSSVRDSTASSGRVSQANRRRYVEALLVSARRQSAVATTRSRLRSRLHLAIGEGRGDMFEGFPLGIDAEKGFDDRAENYQGGADENSRRAMRFSSRLPMIQPKRIGHRRRLLRLEAINVLSLSDALNLYRASVAQARAIISDPSHDLGW